MSGSILLAFAIGILGYLGRYFVNFGDTGIIKQPILKLSFNVFCALAYAIILGVSIDLTNHYTPSKTFIWWAFFGGQISYGVYLFHNVTAFSIPNSYLIMNICNM